MFPTNMIGSSLSLGKIISGLSKTLGIANQIIPLYKEAKPMISNARKIINVAKEFKKSNNTAETKSNISNSTNKKSTLISTNSYSMPKFFQ